MLRRLFTILSALSLLLCMATAALWVRSYFIRDAIVRETKAQPVAIRGEACDVRQTIVTSNRAKLSVAVNRLPSDNSFAPTLRYNRHEPIAPRQDILFDSGVRRDIQLLGFRWYETDGGKGSITIPGRPVMNTNWTPALRIAVPYWFPFLLFSIAPAAWLRGAARRRFRRRRHLCAHCGYDLRATPDRCPECGAVPAAKNPGISN